ncbi:MAG: hypothetical protein EBX39_04570 [Actinobacteria bacterium]|nr:hypothetical protein [Actinomycetota bacterium]
MNFERIPMDPQMTWMEERQSDPDVYSGTGHFLTGWDDQVWILHAMWEHPDIPEALTYAEAEQILSDLGERPPIVTDVAEVDRDALFAGEISFGFDTGAEWGLSFPPSEPWRRLLWSDYMARRGLIPDPKFIPCSRWLGWDFTTNVIPPAEGSLDLAQLESLMSILMEHESGRSPIGTPQVFTWFSFHSPIHVPRVSPDGRLLDPDGLLYVGPLDELASFSAGLTCAPNNIWPEDRNWFITTDADAWGTLIQGPAQLINRIRNNDIPLERFDGTSSDRVTFDVHETFDSRLTPHHPQSR